MHDMIPLLLDEPTVGLDVSSSRRLLDYITKGFGGISDIELGPDGYIYVLSYDKDILSKRFGSIFRIVPAIDADTRRRP